MKVKIVREWLFWLQQKRRQELLTGQEGFLLDLCEDWLDRFAETACIKCGKPLPGEPSLSDAPIYSGPPIIGPTCSDCIGATNPKSMQPPA